MNVAEHRILDTAVSHPGFPPRRFTSTDAGAAARQVQRYLSKRLTSKGPGHLALLHRRAQGWYAQQGQWPLAVNHALAAGDTELALGWMAHHAMALLKAGQLGTLLRWQRETSALAIDPPQRVQLAFAWAHVLSHSRGSAVAHVQADRVEPAAARAAHCIVGGCEDGQADHPGLRQQREPFLRAPRHGQGLATAAVAVTVRRQDTPPPLTPKEQQVLALIAHGQSNKEVARNLNVAPETIKTHLKSIFLKLSVDRRIQAIAKAQALGLLVRDPG